MNELGPDRLAYCAGAGEDVSFDLELIRTGCRVRTFDPTPRAIQYAAKIARDTPGFEFYPVGWWGSEKELRFYAPKNGEHVSHSAVNLQRTTQFFTAHAKPVHQLQQELGDERVDIIKMDIEGAEYQVIDALLLNGPLPTVMCIEFDQPQPVLRTIRALQRLRRSGYRVKHVEGWNFTLIRDSVESGSDR